MKIVSMMDVLRKRRLSRNHEYKYLCVRVMKDWNESLKRFKTSIGLVGVTKQIVLK
jgi:hypothetical protein